MPCPTSTVLWKAWEDEHDHDKAAVEQLTNTWKEEVRESQKKRLVQISWEEAVVGSNPFQVGSGVSGRFGGFRRSLSSQTLRGICGSLGFIKLNQTLG